MKLFKFVKGKEYTIQFYRHFSKENMVIYPQKPTLLSCPICEKEKPMIRYKEASDPLKKKIKEIRAKWLSYRKFWEKPFYFQLRKVYLRLEGVQYKEEITYQVWTILYDNNPRHRNSTTFLISLEELRGL